MNENIIKEIILKAQKDNTFMKKLLENPEETLKSYNLSQKEIDYFKKLDEKIIKGLSPKCFDLKNIIEKKEKC